MKNETYAIEYVDNVPLRVHVFRPEASPEQSDYQALVSIDAFDKRMCLACKKDPAVRRFWLQRKHEWEHLVESDRRMMRLRMSPTYINLPKQIHEDLWTFYREVGWDYKSKRFI